MVPAPAPLPVPVRREHDLLGDRDVPADAYWGVHTLRATENFTVTGMPISVYPLLIDALAAVKEAAARANEELGLLPADKAAAIAAACREIRTGQLHDQFVVDVVQGGAGDLHQHERQRGRRQPCPGAPRPRQGRLRPPPPQRGRQPRPVHQRRLPHRHPHRGDRRRPRTPPRHGRAPGRLRRQGPGVPRGRQDGPHPAPGRGAHDAGPGVLHVRRDAGGGPQPASPRPSSSSTRSTSGPPPSAPASTPPPVTPRPPAATSPN